MRDMTWKDFLTAPEVKRIAKLAEVKRATSKEYRQIFDRARKRMERERGNDRGNEF